MVDVHVLTQYVHPDGIKDAVHEEFVSTCSSDHSEIVAALQVLFPTYVGCYIIPEGVPNADE